MATKHYAEFFFPGTFVSETTTRAVASRDDVGAMPEGAFGYRVFDREEVTLDGVTLKGERKNVSGMTYFGRAYTLDDVRAMFPNERILIDNIRMNKWPRVVRTRLGTWQPVESRDRVIDAAEPVAP